MHDSRYDSVRPIVEDIPARIELARASLRGEGPLEIIPRLDDREVVAFLVTIWTDDDNYVIPLAADMDLVARSKDHSPHDWARNLYLVEALQWVFCCEGRRMALGDAGSTNPSFVRNSAGELRLERSDRSDDSPSADAPGWQRLEEGYVLECPYAVFAFGWVEPDSSEDRPDTPGK